MDRDMFKSRTWWINMFALLALTKTQALSDHGTDSSQVTKWKNEAPAVNVPNLQTNHPRPVAVKCLSDSWEVVVEADLFDTGLMIDGRHLRLGVEQWGNNPACRAVPSGPSQFTVRAPLWDCGTVKLPPTEEHVIYSNILVYSPEPSSDGLLRLDVAAIPLECRYNKFSSVRSVTLLPTWANFVSQTVAESQIHFNLKLMTGDWESVRKSHTYYVGDPMHFEVSSVLVHHEPLRVFVDHCVATEIPDPEAALRYDFIDHQGCFADAYLTNSRARFLSRTEDYRIRFQMDAFTFFQQNAKQIYITCHMTAVRATVHAKSKHRACSLINNRWCSADGDDEECTSCSIPYPLGDSPTRASTTVKVKSEQPETTRGLDRIRQKQQPATYAYVRQSPPQNVHAAHQSSVGLMKGEKRKGTLKVGPLIILKENQS